MSNKSVNEQYVCSGSYPTVGRCNDLVVPIAIADYRCTSTESIANKRQHAGKGQIKISLSVQLNKYAR